MKRSHWLHVCLIPLAAALLVLATVPAAAADEQTLQELRRLIEQQQAQIDALKAKVEALTQAQAQPAVPAVAVASGGTKASVQLYGHVNRGVLIAGDGNETEVYHVDNDNSSTRVGIIGEAAVSDDLTAGAHIEVQMESNSTASVNQNRKSGVGGDSFTERKLDLYLASKTYGKLSVGQGDTASNGTSEVDLSGTSLVGYSGVSDMAGGILFYDNDSQSLSRVDVGDVFSNMDGLSRDDRVRYDTPAFAGFSVSTSLIADDAVDVALRYSGKFPGFKLAGAVAYASPEDRQAYDGQFNGSLSLLLDCGFSATFAGGTRDYDTPGRDDPSFYYGKLGYQWKGFSAGPTALSVDYGQFDDVNANADEADTFGVQFVQKVSDWATEFYVGYRWYDLERSGADFDAINAVLAGARLKF